MKLIVNKYTLSNEKIKNSYRIASITDIHSNNKVLANITTELIDINPDIVVISGDTLDSINNYNNNKIFKLLSVISKNFPTFISYGNNDTVVFEPKSLLKKEVVDTNNLAFFDMLKKETDCIILGNLGIEEFKDLTIRSYNLPCSWYQTGEDKNSFIDGFICYYLPSDMNKFTILSSHSPNGYIDNNGKINISLNEKLMNTLILSGHNHGGMIPLKLQQKLSNTKLAGRGILNPYFRIFPKNSYGYYNEDTTNLIISNGVTKWPDDNSSIGKIMNRIYSPEIEIIDLKNGEHNIQYEGYKVKKLTK